eukprot:1147821-Amphidinium_carterae.1
MLMGPRPSVWEEKCIACPLSCKPEKHATLLGCEQVAPTEEMEHVERKQENARTRLCSGWLISIACRLTLDIYDARGTCTKQYEEEQGAGGWLIKRIQGSEHKGLFPQPQSSLK